VPLGEFVHSLNEQIAKRFELVLHHHHHLIISGVGGEASCFLALILIFALRFHLLLL